MVLQFSSFWVKVLTRNQIEVMRRYGTNIPGWRLLPLRSSVLTRMVKSMVDFSLKNRGGMRIELELELCYRTNVLSRSPNCTFPSESMVNPNACIQFASSILNRLLIGKPITSFERIRSPHSTKLDIHVAYR